MFSFQLQQLQCISACRRLPSILPEVTLRPNGKHSQVLHRGPFEVLVAPFLFRLEMMKDRDVSIRGLVVCSLEEVCYFLFLNFLIQLAFLTLVRHCGAKAQDTDGNFMSNGYSQGEICYTKTGLKRSMEYINTLYSRWIGNLITLRTLI